MDVKDALIQRHSTRWFKNQSIKIDMLKKIIKEAEKVPTWVNSQPYKAYVITGKTLELIRKKHEKLGNVGEHGHSDLQVMLRSKWSRVAQDNMEAWTQGINRSIGDDWQKVMGASAKQLYNAQAIIYLTLPTGYSEWSLYDLGAFGMAIMLVAKEMGIDSMPAYQFVCYPEEVRKNISISDDEQLIMGIGLGYRDENSGVNRITSTRLSLDKISEFYD